MEALRLLVSKCVTYDNESQRKGLKKLLVADVKRAFFNALFERKVLIELLCRRPIGRRRLDWRAC